MPVCSAIEIRLAATPTSACVSSGVNAGPSKTGNIGMPGAIAGVGAPQSVRQNGLGCIGHSRDGARSPSRTGRRGRMPRRDDGRWSRTRIDEGSASASGIPPIGAGGVGRSSPGPGPPPSSSADPASSPNPWKSTNRGSPTRTIPHGSPDATTGPAVCSPSRANSATSIGSNIAITTAANRNENRDRRGSGEANTPPTRCSWDGAWVCRGPPDGRRRR